MKRNLNFIWLIAVSVLAFSCKKDNYDAPSSQLTGRIVYKGTPIEVEYDRVPFELYQYGFGKVGPINGTITPEGNYAHLLFDGDYKFVIRAGQGPFLWPSTGGKQDSIAISVKGNTTKDIEVEPYYMVRTPNITYAASKVNATFKVEKIITDARAKNIEQVRLFINKTAFVSPTDNLAPSTATSMIAGGSITDPNNITLSASVPTIVPAQNYVFARIGVKIVGVEDWIFSSVVKLQF